MTKDKGYGVTMFARARKYNIFQRLAMPLLELGVYYREQRKYHFGRGKKLKYIQLRKIFYPLFVKILLVDFFRKQTITVVGKQRKYKEQVIYACMHIGENDLENIYEGKRH